jgi:hypothetical protein
MPEIGEVPGGGNHPWGDIIQVQTPAIDRLTAQLQQQQADRKAYVQKEGQNTEDLLNKELANVRSVDMNTVTDAYNNWKQLSQPLYFNKGLQANPRKFNEAQMAANAALGSLRTKINQSAKLNELGKSMAANRFAKPDAYDDNAGDMLSTLYSTPMDKVNAATYKGQTVDLTNIDNYRYKAGNYDFGKLHQSAIGKSVTHYDDGQTDASGIQTTQHGYQYGNTPLQYRDAYLPGLAGSQANRGARAGWAEHSANQQDIDALDAAYQNSPNWQKMGIAPQQLPPYNPNDPVGNEATYQAKKYLVSMNPAEVKASVVTNQGAKMKATFSHQELMETIKEGNREKLKTLSHEFKRMDIKEQSSILDNTYNSIIDDAKKSGTTTYKTASGQVSKQYEIKVSPEVRKEFSFDDDKGHKIYPDAFRIDENGSTVTPIFYKGADAGNPNAYRGVDAGLSKPMTSVEFKARLGKALFGAKEAVKESSTTTIGSGIKWQ